MTTQQNYNNMLARYLNHEIVQLDDAKSFHHRLAVLIIFAMGTALRVYAWYAGEGYLYYAINDEMLAYRYALGFLAGETHTYYLAQPAFAAGQAPGPLWTLFWVMLLKLGQGSVHFALCWMALFNSIAIYLLYRLARHFVTPGLALAATLFFALSPWAIYYSVGMWNPLPLAVFGGVLFLSLWKVLNQDDSPYIFWVCLFSAILPQFHMIGVFYYPVILFLLVITTKSINKSWLVIGISAGVVLYIPYLIGEWNHDFANTRNMLTGTADHSFGVVKILTAPVTMLTSIPAGWTGRAFSTTIAYANTWFGSVYILLALCLISLVFALAVYLGFLKRTFYLFKHYWKNPGDAFACHPKSAFLASLIVLPLILFAFTRHGYATRYTLLMFSLLFLLPPLFFQSLQNGFYKKLSFASGALILFLNIYLVITFFQYQGHVINNSTRFSPSFKKMEYLANELYHRVGHDKQIKIILSGNIQTLPEGERKVAIAFTEYFDLLNNYMARPHRQASVTLLMELNDSLGDSIKKDSILYQANSVSFIKFNSLNPAQNQPENRQQ